MNFYLARQPIFDQDQMVIGYEIVYKDTIHDTTTKLLSEEEEKETALLLLNSYLDIGMDVLLGGHIAFVNCSENLILKNSPLLLNKSTTVIQIDATINPTEDFLDKIISFKSDGYLIALTNYTSGYKHEALVALSDIIQIDLTRNNLSDLKKIMRHFQLSTQILLAKNVHSQNDYDSARSLGFDLFEGYYFCKPRLTKGLVLPVSNVQNLEILKLVNSASPNIKLISKHIEEDINLTVKLLRLVNSSHHFVNQIHSVQHALAMIGVDAFRNWLNIALLDSFLADQTPEIIKQSMMRMRLIEGVGKQCYMNKDIDSLKLIGLLSVLDVLLKKSMMDAVNPLPIDRELKITLIGNESRFSDIYQIVLSYEKGDFRRANAHAKKANFDMEVMPRLYTEAVQWADELYLLIYPNEED